MTHHALEHQQATLHHRFILVSNPFASLFRTLGLFPLFPISYPIKQSPLTHSFLPSRCLLQLLRIISSQALHQNQLIFYHITDLSLLRDINFHLSSLLSSSPLLFSTPLLSSPFLFYSILFSSLFFYPLFCTNLLFSFLTSLLVSTETPP